MRTAKQFLFGSLGATVALSGLAALALPALPAHAASNVHVSEFHYDDGTTNDAGGVGEFVELTAPAGTNLDGWTLQLVNGNGSTVYRTEHLSGTVADQADGVGTHVVGFPSGNVLQNGSPDGIALLDATGVVVEFVSYEGSMTALLGSPEASVTSMDTGAAVETNGTPADHSVQRQADGTWIGPAIHSRGAVNSPSPDPDPEPDPEPTEPVAIADIQGDGVASPLINTTVTTQGVVTAAYPTGGFNGFYLQTPDVDTTPGRSDAVFVYGEVPADLAIGDSVAVTGLVKEYNGLTEIDVSAGTVAEVDALGAVSPKTVIPGTDCALPGTDCLDQAALEVAREAVEGEVFAPTAPFTVTDVYDGSASNPPNSGSSSNFGEIGLAAHSDAPLTTPTDIIDAQDTAAIAARTRWNNAHRVVLDDGSSTTYWNTANTAAGQDSPLPWLTPDHHVRVGAAVTFDQPVILDNRFGWKIQPTSQVVGAPTGKVTFEQDRPAAPAEVGGDIKLATFNVLNYFTTLGVDVADCTSYKDRAGNPIAVNRCPGNGPRGAWDRASFERQQAKIVAAINTIDADVVTVEEIENNLVVDGGDRDEALAALVTALNAAAGPGTWDYVRSPASASLPANRDEQDVIRTGFLYRPASVDVVGEADMLFDTSEFANAREPFAAVFAPSGAPADSRFAVIVNHFKSKGSGVDDGTGQGNANPDRIAQAERLSTYADAFAAERGVDAVFLAGDFNAYSQEDPMQVLYADGYAKLASDGHSYSFDGQSGSLDHVVGNPAAQALVSDATYWEINANETVFNQYSRYNYVGTDLYDEGPFGASDHNPEIVGINATASDETEIQVLGTNDFHGRILQNARSSESGAAVLSGAVKQLRDENPNTVFAAAGDLIGASTFESFIQHDKPTIDALNEAGLDVSAVGNHELDAGYDDLVNRVLAAYDEVSNPYGGAEWAYIAANLKVKATGDDAVPATWIKTIDGVDVGFVGAVTEDLPALVSPDGIADIEVADIVDSVNAEAADLTANGAEIVVMLVHEGATSTQCDAATFTDPGTAWGNITQNVSADVDAIISGHTHLAYDCAFEVEEWVADGRAVTERPVVSAGQYGMNLNQLRFTVDADGEVTGLESAILPLMGPDPDGSGPGLPPALYPADPVVESIVADAKTEADVLGAVKLGQLAGPFNRAKLADGTTENRGGESTLGNKVAEVHRWATRNPESGSAQIAFMNPGGLRADMVGTVNGDARDLTYKQAAVVQPFANTLVNMKLTGAQLETVLEQQWQRTPAGAVPSRPFLRLGVSDGFTYTYVETPVTVQDTATFRGEVTGMWLAGEPIDPAATYSVTVNSFLASGGDNFHAFADGADAADTGKADLAAMVDYMAEFAAQEPLPVDHSQRAVEVEFPADAPASYAPGDTVTFDVGSWSMSTADDVKDTEVEVWLGDTNLGAFPVDSTIGTDVYDQYGTATVQAVLPATLAEGEHALVLKGAETGTEIAVDVTVAAAEESVTPTVRVRTARQFYGRAATVRVEVDAGDVATEGGTVVLRAGTRALGTAVVGADGVAWIRVRAGALPPAARPYRVTAEYAGVDGVAPATGTGRLKVVKAPAGPRSNSGSPRAGRSG